MASAGRILVADDDPALAEAVAAGLRDRYEVQCVGTGADAIAVICETGFDLILLDHRLPDIVGVDLLRLITRAFLTTTVVLMTGTAPKTWRQPRKVLLRGAAAVRNMRCAIMPITMISR